MEMDINYYLEKAKDILQRDKHLMPVLFIDTEDDVEERTFVLGLAMDMEKIDRRKMMMELGKNFTKKYKDKKIRSLSFIFEAWVTRIDTNTNLAEKIEAIVVSEWNIETDKKYVVTQNYEIIDGNVIWKGEPQKVEDTKAYILEAFMQGYEQPLSHRLEAI